MKLENNFRRSQLTLENSFLHTEELLNTKLNRRPPKFFLKYSSDIYVALIVFSMINFLYQKSNKQNNWTCFIPIFLILLYNIFFENEFINFPSSSISNEKVIIYSAIFIFTFVSLVFDTLINLISLLFENNDINIDNRTAISTNVFILLLFMAIILAFPSYALHSSILLNILGIYQNNRKYILSIIPKNSKELIEVLKKILFIICIYAATPFSVNINQRNYIYTYSKLTWVFLSNLSLYLTIFTVSIYYIYRYFNKNIKLRKLLNNILPTVLTFEIIVTLIFWTLYFYDEKLLINKKFLQPGFTTPLLSQLGIHLFPFVLLFFVQNDIKINKTKEQQIVFFGTLLSWLTALIYFGESKGKYAYPIFNYLRRNILTFQVSILFVIIFFYMIHSIYVKLKSN